MVYPASWPVDWLFTDFEAVVGRIDSENIQHIVLGDFNCDILATSSSNNATLQNIADT